MPILATWGTFQFFDNEVTSFEWDMAQTEYVSVPKIVGYPNIQQVGDRLAVVSIGLRFSGAGARTRLNDLSNFAIGKVDRVDLGTTYLGFYHSKTIRANYTLVADSTLTVIAVTLELEQDP